MSAVMTNKIQQSQGLLSFSLKIEEETLLTQKQGIVTILGCDTENKNTASASSLRRTLSADMSSKKWLPQKGSSPMQKTASSEEIFNPKTIADSFSSSSEEVYEESKDFEAEAERERLEIWSSIQRNKKVEQEKIPAGSIDTWSSIISMKSNDEISKSLTATAPYIHPLMKRSKSCSLSEKSLEICTESLGSETGSDGVFSPSSYSSSETGETEEKQNQQQQETEQEAEQEEEDEKVTEPEEEEVSRLINYAASVTTRKSPPRSFPPPLPSLSHQTGPSLHMRPHRDNGRLVLEAVTLPSINNFSVQRQDGRLVLTFANPQEEEGHAEDMEEDEEVEKEFVEELNEEFVGFEEDDDLVAVEEEKEDEDEEDEDDEENDAGDSEVTMEVGESERVMEKGLKKFSSGVTSVKRLTMMVNNNKPIGVVNRNPNWSEKFNEVANFENVNVVKEATSPCPIAKSLPPRPRVARLIPSSKTAITASGSASAAAAASLNFNAYEHYWRTTTKSSTNGATTTNPLAQEDNNKNNNSALKNYNSNKLIVSNENQQVLVLRGKNGDYLVQNLKSCKDSRRSFLFWEPYCIATS